MQRDTGSILHSVVTAKPHKNMQPANRSVKAVLGTAWQWYPNPTWNCCFGRYASAEEILRPKRPIWSQPRVAIKSSEWRTSHSLHVCGLVCSKWFFSSPLFIPIYIISTVFFTVMVFNCAYKCGCLRRIVFTFSLVTNVITCSLIFRGNIFTLEVIKVLPLWTTNYKELVGMDGRHIKPKDFENHVYKLALELHLWFFF